MAFPKIGTLLKAKFSMPTSGEEDIHQNSYCLYLGKENNSIGKYYLVFSLEISKIEKMYYQRMEVDDLFEIVDS